VNIKISLLLFFLSPIIAQQNSTILELMAKNAEYARSKMGRNSRLIGVGTTATVLAAGMLTHDDCAQDVQKNFSGKRVIVYTAALSGVLAFWAYRLVKLRTGHATRGDLKRIARGAHETQFAKDYLAGSVQENVNRLLSVDRTEAILAAWKLQEWPAQLETTIKHLKSDRLPCYCNVVSQEQALEEITDLKLLQNKCHQILTSLGEHPDFVEKIYR
jgi:hypothetical protein